MNETTLVYEGALTNQPHPIDGDSVLCVNGEPLEDAVMADLVFTKGDDGVWRLPGRVRITIALLPDQEAT